MNNKVHLLADKDKSSRRHSSKKRKVLSIPCRCDGFSLLKKNSNIFDILAIARDGLGSYLHDCIMVDNNRLA